MRIGFYPGTFDPITLGHTDIIQRATALVDRLVIGVAINRDKGPLFTLEERVAMVEAECAEIVAKTAQDSTTATPSPPGTGAVKATASRISRLAIEPRAMMLPARMNSGTDSSNS